MSAEDDIMDALLTYVEDLTFSPPIDVVWPNYVYRPTVGVKYLEARILPNDSDRIMISGDTDRLYGILMLTLNTPLNQGDEDVTQDAGTICDHFATDTRLSSGNTTVRVTKRPVKKEGLNIDEWWKTPILISYEAFV